MPYTYYSTTTTTTGGSSFAYSCNTTPYYYTNYNADYSLSYSALNVRRVFSQKELNTVLKALAEDDYTWLGGLEITEDTYPDYFEGANIVVFSGKDIAVI